MKNNMSVADRIIRMVVALLVVVLYFTGTINGILAIVLLIFAGVFIITATIGFCPLYKLIGINFRKNRTE